MHPTSRRLDGTGAALLAGAIAIFLLALFVASAPNASADKHPKASGDAAGPILDNKFKGHLPITELTEDQAIVHALNRLAYGPRPGDVERVRQMGLEKWIDQQLHPDSIDDSALDQRLKKYPTLNMSSEKLLDEFLPPGQVIKKDPQAREEYQQQMQEKRRAAVAQVMETGNENVDRAQEMVAEIQGPGRIIAELSMGKIDRAIYSNRQLDAVMEDFWFNHFNVFAGKGADRWLLTSYVRDTIRPRTMGKFQDLLLATAKSPAMLFFLDNWQSVDPVAFDQHKQDNAARRERYQGMFAGGNPPAPGTFPMPGGLPPGAEGAVRQRQQDRGLNENYGREVMELHTVGVDAGYTQQDVIEMARCLTGWTVREPRRDPEFVFKPEFHAEGQESRDGPHVRLWRREGWRRGARDAGERSTHGKVHLDGNSAPFCFGQSAARTHRSHGAELRIHGWRYSQRAEDDDLFAGVLVEGSLSRKGENAV